MNDYEIRGREIYSAKGKLVATLDNDGNPVMAPGMAGAHSAKVRAFLADHAAVAAAWGDEKAPEAPAEAPAEAAEAPTEAPAEAPAAEGNTNVFVGNVPPAPSPQTAPVAEPPTAEDWNISTIPDDRLPPFSKELGVNTPGFGEWVKHHKMTPEQVACLVRRLENRRRK